MVTEIRVLETANVYKRKELLLLNHEEMQFLYTQFRYKRHKSMTQNLKPDRVFFFFIFLYFFQPQLLPLKISKRCKGLRQLRESLGSIVTVQITITMQCEGCLL